MMSPWRTLQGRTTCRQEIQDVSSRGVLTVSDHGAGVGQLRLIVTAMVVLIALKVPALASAASTSWTPVASLQTGRVLFESTSGPCQGNTDVTCLYAIGGSGPNGNLDSVEMYTPSRNSWSAVAALPSGRSGLGATSGPCEGDISATCIYAIGGVNGNRYFHTLSGVDMYSPITNTWTSVAALQTPRFDLGATRGPCQGKIDATCLYAIGGITSLAGTPLNSVEMYSPGSNSWSAVASLQTGRYVFGTTSGPCQATNATCLYAIGGAGSFTVTSSVEMYTPSNNAWTYVVPLHIARDKLGAANGPCANNSSTTCLYAAGGYDGSKRLDSVEMYTPSDNAWTAVPSLQSPRDQLGATSGPCHDDSSAICLYAMGGDNNLSTYLNSAETYKPSNLTPAWVSRFTAQQKAAAVRFDWRLPHSDGVLGFDLYADRSRLNPRTIAVHAAARYHSTFRWSGTARFTLRVLLTNGKEITVSTR